MAEELCTVDYAAERLKLHPKTVLRHIREGRLPARRLGKAYRIRRSDLEAFAGVPPAEASADQEPWVTSIVDIPNVEAQLAQKWARSVTNSLHARPHGGPPMRADVIYEPERAHLKIIIVGPPGDSVNLLSLIRVWIDQLTA